MGYWRYDDLNSYFDKYAPAMKGKKPIVIGVNGGGLQDENASFYPLEANLDFEYIMALTSRPTINYQIGGLKITSKMNPTMNGLLAALDSTYLLPWVQRIATLWIITLILSPATSPNRWEMESSSKRRTVVRSRNYHLFCPSAILG